MTAGYRESPPPATILNIEGFGDRAVRPGQIGRVVDPDEDFYVAFRSRSILMSWLTYEPNDNRQLAWSMRKAGLFATLSSEGSSESCVAYAQVAVKPELNDVILRIPALVQCFHDALERFGVASVTALQLTARSLRPSPIKVLTELTMCLDWFDHGTGGSTHALLSLDELTADRTEPDPFATLRNVPCGGFTFGILSSTVPAHRIAGFGNGRLLPELSPADTGVPVTMPGWTPSAIGWTLAMAVHAILSLDSHLPELVVRISLAEEG